MENFALPCTRVSRLKALALFVFRPGAFIELAVEHDIAMTISETPEIKERFLRGEYTPDRENHLSNSKHRTLGLRGTLVRTAVFVFGSAAIGLILGMVCHRFIGPIPNALASALQAVGAAVLLWGTLWQLSKDFQSFGGKTLPERVHSWIFNCLYTFGTVLFFVVYGWQA